MGRHISKVVSVVFCAVLAIALTGCPPPTPSLATVSPASVSSTLGGTLTLTGTNFRSGAMVTFTRADGETVLGTVAATDVTRRQLTVAAPATTDIVEPENVSVTVTNPGGSPSLPLLVAYVPPPNVADVDPASVPASIATEITITGTEFAGPGAQVRFELADETVIGTVDATVVDAETITCTTPTANVTEDTPVNVLVINWDDQVSIPVTKAIGTITYLAPPIIDDATDSVPATIPSTVTITGSNFDPNSTVVFDLPGEGDTDAADIVVNPGGTQITCTSPALDDLASNATVTVTIGSPDGQSDSFDITYIAPPTVTQVSPTAVPASIQTTVTITGANFAGPGATVEFIRPDESVIGDAAVAATVVNSTTITCQSPLDAAITEDMLVTVNVINGDGQDAEVVTKATGEITYLARPTITQITTPITSTIQQTMTIEGTNFEANSTVSFNLPGLGATAATNVVVVSDTEITCTTPLLPGLLADAVGVPVTVAIPAPDGQTASASVTYLAPPVITDITPDPMRTSVAEAVTITGANFDAGCTVVFGLPGGDQAAGSVTRVSDGEITCTSPILLTLTQDTNVTVTVTNADTDDQVDTFDVTYSAAPRVSSVTPIELPTQFTFPATIIGTGFKAGATVTFQGASATGVTVVNATTITCTAPARGAITEPTAVDVVVTNTDTQTSDDAEANGSVTYYPPPEADSADLSHVPATISKTITITGDNFRGFPLLNAVGNTTVVFRYAASPFATIDTVDATIVDDNHLTCMTPVITGMTVDTGVTMEVVCPQGQAQSTDLLAVTYDAPPVLVGAAFAPDPVTATISKDFSITSGANFDLTAEGVKVKFQRVDGDDPVEIGLLTLTAVGATQIDGLVAGSEGTPVVTGLTEDISVEVYVQNLDDQQWSESPVTITYSAPPILSSIVHDTYGGNEVPATIAAPVTITGSNFADGAAFRVTYTLSTGDVAQVPDSVDSATQISDTTPAENTGDLEADRTANVKVTNADGQVSNTITINYQAEPSISAIETDIFVADVGGGAEDVLPATIASAFTATITNGVINATNAAAIAGGPTINFAIGAPVANANATNTSVTNETTAAGTSPTFLNVTDQVATVTYTDEYGQAGTATATITITAPPTLSAFEATFNQTYGPFTDDDIFPSTIASAFALTGTNLRDDATVTFASVTADWTDDVTAAVPGANTTATGNTPVMDPAPAAHVTDVTVSLENTDGQSTAVALNAIKATAPPTITAATIVGDLTPFVVANGPFRNSHDGTNPLTIEVTGTNLDSTSPAGDGTTFVELDGGAVAIDDVEFQATAGGDDEARIINATSVRFELDDNGNTDGLGSTLLADVFGAVNIVSLTDYTGQSTEVGLDEIFVTVRGPLTTDDNEGHAVAMATGSLLGGDREDLVVLTSGDDGEGAGVSRLDIYYGTTEDALPIDPDESVTLPADTISGKITPGSRNMLITDFNADGFGDLFVGIPDNDMLAGSAATSSGFVYIWLSDGAPIDFNQLGLPITLAGEEVIDYAPATDKEAFGAALAVGDVNGDNRMDLVVAAPGQLGSDGTSTSAGVVYLYRGNVDGLSLVPSLVFENNNADLGGDDDLFGLGLMVADVDGDGADDLFVGAPGFDNGGGNLDAGRVRYYLGDSNMDDTHDGEIVGQVPGGNFAYLTQAGVNEDGLADFIIGSPKFNGNEGSIRYYRGQVTEAGTFFVTPASDGDPSGDGGLTYTGGVSDTMGFASSMFYIDETEGILIGAPNLTAPLAGVNGHVSRFTIGSEAKAWTVDFTPAQIFTLPDSIDLAATGEQFGACVVAGNVTGLDVQAKIGPQLPTAVDVFINALNADEGSMNGFLMIYPKGWTPVIPN